MKRVVAASAARRYEIARRVTVLACWLWLAGGVLTATQLDAKTVLLDQAPADTQSVDRVADRVTRVEQDVADLKAMHVDRELALLKDSTSRTERLTWGILAGLGVLMLDVVRRILRDRKLAA